MLIIILGLKVLPTHVGVILKRIFRIFINIRTTHTRGGDPVVMTCSFLTDTYYPHTWG